MTELLTTAPITTDPVADALGALGRGTLAAAGVGYFAAVAVVAFEAARQDLREAAGVDR